MDLRWRRLFALFLLLAGLLLLNHILLISKTQLFSPLDLIAVATAAILTLLGSLILSRFPALQTHLSAALDHVRNPQPRTANAAAFAIAMLATFALIAVAILQHRPLYPQWHDEQCYTIQMQLLAKGHLWLPQHPQADFFESFYLNVKPKYAPMYFPGTALLLMPAVWLQLPSWLLPVLVSGCVVGLFYRIVTALIDGAAGLLAALLIMFSTEFLQKSTMVMSHPPMMLIGLLTVWSYLCWRQHRSLRWALAMGVFAGWSAIIRLADAPCFILPVALAILLDLRRQPLRAWTGTLLSIVAGALPFIALQAIFNIGVTGSILHTPHQYYTERSAPQALMGFHDYDPLIVPQTTLPQKLSFYRTFVAPAVRMHRPETVLQTWMQSRLPITLNAGLCHPLLLIFIPVGLLGLGARRRWVFFAAFPLFILIYLFYAFLQSYYPLIAVPAIIFSTLLGFHVLQDVFPGQRALLGAFLSLLTILLLAASIPNLFRDLHETGGAWPTIKFVREDLPGLVNKPALVLCRFGPKANTHEEPVYNIDVAWPDDAPIVLAHDLGPARDRDLIEYYARLQPDRTVYIFDRTEFSLTMLGNVRDLMLRLRASPSPTPAP